ncbi:hypothetical protein EVAR_43286_1 [Eumeta japonica]|uniref:Uncharacterized protein n=1 Tax=Eumeta variegata TaxID=151549 RepID=A0A4C1X200_EUMVA|nr:hypothetical protein EVAR_43286_1 [Eumeta japonica]
MGTCPGPRDGMGPLVPARLPNDNRYLAHKQSMMTYLARSKAVGRVDMDLLSQHQKEVDYWRNVLKRIVAVVKFLASRGLPFRGDNEILGSPNNGNYLGCVELLSEFDPFLADHLKKFGNPGKEIHDIPIKDCRGQSYDNASNMSGKYSGLQTRIKEKCEFATFVPCAGHSLNLVGVHAAGDKFDNFESSAKEKNPESDYKDLSQRTRRRSSRQSFFLMALRHQSN